MAKINNPGAETGQRADTGHCAPEQRTELTAAARQAMPWLLSAEERSQRLRNTISNELRRSRISR